MDIFQSIKDAFNKPVDDSPMKNTALNRRDAIKAITALGTMAVSLSSCSADEGNDQAKMDEWDTFFQTNYRLMTRKEKRNTVNRLERLAKNKRKKDVVIKDTEPIDGVLYGYALNISTCKGYKDCVKACMKENNLDPEMGIQYIRVAEMKSGKIYLEDSNTVYDHQVPSEGHFYLPMQCMHCENPPCVPVCPVGATWKEKDGIVVVDYNWCIGCRYCQAACPYFARRFNWQEPDVANENLNTDQHYLGNRDRYKGVMEKCHFCVHRTREGRMPACQEACPTGSRIFGNLLDPDSEIRWIIENKKVFRLKEELNTQPKFYYYMD